MCYSTITEKSPSIVGISCHFTAQLENFLHAAKLVKKLNRDVIIVGGGAHFSAVDKSFLEHNDCVDFFISGEGELSFLELVRAIKKNEPFNEIPGLYYKSKDSLGNFTTKHNNPVLIDDLDLLPFPAYHLIDMEYFFKLQSEGQISREGGEGRSITIITSRGCPYNCLHCSIHLHMGNKMRAHSANYVISHIKYVVDTYKIKHIFFEDDNISYYKKRFNTIIDSIIKNKFEISWDTPNGVRADTLDRKMLETMKKAGCSALIIAPESGDPQVVKKIIGKNLQINKIIDVAMQCKLLRIDLSAFFMFGLPGETKKNIKKSFNFALMLYKEYDVTPIFNRATPLPGTGLYQVAKQGNFLCRDITPQSLSEATYPNGNGLISTQEFTPEDLSKMYEEFSDEIKRVQQQKSKLQPNSNYHLLRYFWPITD